VIILLPCMSQLVAPFEDGAMSELSLLSGVNRTSRLRPPTSHFDPQRSSARSLTAIARAIFGPYQIGV
jgi:hypothetical protein